MIRWKSLRCCVTALHCNNMYNVQAGPPCCCPVLKNRCVSTDGCPAQMSSSKETYYLACIVVIFLHQCNNGCVYFVLYVQGGAVFQTSHSCVSCSAKYCSGFLPNAINATDTSVHIHVLYICHFCQGTAATNGLAAQQQTWYDSTKHAEYIKKAVDVQRPYLCGLEMERCFVLWCRSRLRLFDQTQDARS